ncbi:sulfite dehydrogenase (cytochrome) subunit SorA apoprotein [Chthoniobacter flavus]|nr:molybdopterin-dependent oxidoreductase [Chthoniobacter flavus]TCO87179.1 sulfite dehydrogenase (cytochrome) subunit SorA apoprotein [Chthoniobacter flavus]
MHLRSSLGRRQFLRNASLAGAAALLGNRAFGADTVTLPFANGERPLATFPQKRPLILQTSRPPQLETPFSVFNEGILTPNDAFFVRYHLANIPTSIDPEKFRLEVKGRVKTPLTLSLEALRHDFENVEVVAVNQCSGNSRGFFVPRVGGGQSGNGAMGNAKWRGVRLKDVLEKAGLQADAKQVTCNGLDGPVLPQTPDFVKALDIDHALDGDVMLAFEMNGAPLPMLNGFPLRLVVPGYYGTYWVKHLNELTVIPDVLANFWMATGYRIPNTPGACIEPGTTTKNTVPINRFNVRSFITSHADGAQVTTKQVAHIRGIAFDGGSGIREVLFSGDGGKSWQSAELGDDLGRFSFREWKLAYTPPQAGAAEWKCRAINRVGQSQPMEALWNPAGYMRNVVETVKVTIA